MADFDQDQPRETRRVLAFRRRPGDPPPRGLWARLFTRPPPVAEPSTLPPPLPRPHEWAEALLRELGARFADQGWPWTTGPWSWYEPDYRIETTVDGARVVLILIVPYRETDEGLICSEEPPEALLPDELTRRVFDVVRGVLQGRPEVHGLQEFPTGKDWFASTRR